MNAEDVDGQSSTSITAAAAQTLPSTPTALPSDMSNNIPGEPTAPQQRNTALPASLAADVVEAFNIANSIIWPLPSVLLRRMQQDTRTQLQSIWTAMNPGRDDALPAFLQVADAAAHDTGRGTVHLRDELLVTQMRTLLSQDVEKVCVRCVWWNANGCFACMQVCTPAHNNNNSSTHTPSLGAATAAVCNFGSRQHHCRSRWRVCGKSGVSTHSPALCGLLAANASRAPAAAASIIASAHERAQTIHQAANASGACQQTPWHDHEAPGHLVRAWRRVCCWFGTDVPLLLLRAAAAVWGHRWADEVAERGVYASTRCPPSSAASGGGSCLCVAGWAGVSSAGCGG